MDFIKQISPYRKAVVTVVIGILQLLALYFTLTADGILSAEDKNALITNIILSIGGTAGVYSVSNTTVKK